MFIVAKRSFKVPRKNGEMFLIRKDYVGDIPDDVAEHWLIRAAIHDGTIATPQSGKDRDLYQADAQAGDKEKAADIRPDAPKETEGGMEEPPKKAASRKRNE